MTLCHVHGLLYFLLEKQAMYIFEINEVDHVEHRNM